MPPSLGAWVRATSLGWLLGIPLVIAFALLAESIGIGGIQTMVGLGVGCGVGVMQARALTPWLPRWSRWAAVTAAGLSLPFIVADALPRLGVDIGFSLTWCVVIGGLLVGVGQGVLLHPHVRNAIRWVPFSVVGWAAAAGMAALADGLGRSGARGIAGALAYLGLIAVGGVVLGAVTGVGWRFLPPRS